MVQAYILIQTEVGKAAQVAKEVAAIKGVTQAELGKMVVLDHLLRGDNLDQYAGHLSLQDRLSARLILEKSQDHAVEAVWLRKI